LLSVASTVTSFHLYFILFFFISMKVIQT